jgi:hypothetical protein
MSRPKKRSKFLDDEADQSGSGHDGESDGCDEATMEDMEFIDDNEESARDDPEDGNLPDLKKIKIRKSERKLSKDDYRLILENSGIKAPSCKKRSRKKTRKEKKKIYKDSDDDGFHSGDEGFIATSSDDDSSGAEEAGRDMQSSIQSYVQKQGALFDSIFLFIGQAPFDCATTGISLKKASAARETVRQQTPTLTFMERDAFYLAVEAESGQQEQAPSHDEGSRHEKPKAPVPLCMRLGSAAGAKAAVTTVPLEKPPQKPPKDNKKPAVAGAKATVRPMDAHTRKVAPIFLGRQQAIKDAAAAKSAASSKKKVEPGLYYNPKDGKSFIRHRNGLETPHDM